MKEPSNLAMMINTVTASELVSFQLITYMQTKKI